MTSIIPKRQITFASNMFMGAEMSQKIQRTMFWSFLISFLLVATTLTVSADAAVVAVSVPTSAEGDGSPTPQSVNGWRFTANDDLTLTHLGLFDYLDDGFEGQYELGLFRFSDMALLTSGLLPAGTAFIN